MAFVNTTRATNSGLADRFAAMVSAVKLAVQRRQVYQQTLRELNALSDRDLMDLGIARSMISDVANQAAYGA